MKTRPCYDCGVQYPPYVMEFDHRNPKEKSFDIGGSQLRSVDAILREAAKCDIVCANCHAVRTHMRRADG